MTSVQPRKGFSILTHPEHCTGCLTCELRCALRFVRAFTPAGAAIQIRRSLGCDPAFAVTFTENCDNCGICARFCPYGALELSGRLVSQ